MTVVKSGLTGDEKTAAQHQAEGHGNGRPGKARTAEDQRIEATLRAAGVRCRTTVIPARHA